MPPIFVRSQELATSTARETIYLLAEEYARLAGISELAPALVAAAEEREAEDSTYVGRSMAIPHARIKASIPAGLYLARRRAGIPWQGTKQATIIAFLAVPEDVPEAYLAMVSRLMRWRLQVDDGLLYGHAEALACDLKRMWN